MQAQIHEGGDVWFACVIQLCSQEINRLKKKPIQTKAEERRGRETRSERWGRDPAGLRTPPSILLTEIVRAGEESGGLGGWADG